MRQKAAIFGQEIGDGEHAEPSSAPPPRPSLNDYGCAPAHALVSGVQESSIRHGCSETCLS